MIKPDRPTAGGNPDSPRPSRGRSVGSSSGPPPRDTPTASTGARSNATCRAGSPFGCPHHQAARDKHHPWTCRTWQKDLFAALSARRTHQSAQEGAAPHRAPAAKHESAERPRWACPRQPAPRTATSHKRCCYLVVTGSAIRIRAWAIFRTRIGAGFRHEGRSIHRRLVAAKVLISPESRPLRTSRRDGSAPNSDPVYSSGEA